MSAGNESDRRGGDPGSERGGEFQRAVDRLEKAVHEFVGNTNEHISTRATRFMDDAAERLEGEARRRARKRERSDDSSASRADEARNFDHDDGSRRGRHRRRHRGSYSSREPGYRTSKLYRDTRRQKIAGVCAGLARYFGVEIWVVRCLAITGLIFMSSIIIPAYIIAWFVLPTAPDGETLPRGGSLAADHSAMAPELGARLSPRHSLQNVHSELDQLELKLRRMESHVTSGQYELQRELRKIDT